jgi:hypothetical protein
MFPKLLYVSECHILLTMMHNWMKHIWKFVTLLQFVLHKFCMCIHFNAAKWLEYEGDYSPLSSPKVKNAWTHCISISPYSFMTWCLIKCWDNFMFAFTFNSVSEQDRQCVYKRNIEAHSHNRYCSGKALGIKYSECVSVIQHVIRVHCIMLLCVVSLALAYFSSLEWHDFQKSYVT